MRTTSLLAVLSLGAACHSPPAPQLSPSAVVLDLPIVKQDELYECGLASISALCQYWGRSIPDEQRVELARTAIENEGLSGEELQRALRDLGFETFLFEGALDRSPTGLYRHVDAGRPLLVMTSAAGEHHYVLFLGYDPEQDLTILLDPVRGRVARETAAFDRSWSAAQRFTLLALPPGETPRGTESTRSSP